MHSLAQVKITVWRSDLAKPPSDDHYKQLGVKKVLALDLAPNIIEVCVSLCVLCL